MIYSPESSIVKVLYGERGEVAGAGVLIGKRWVLTCRHVIKDLPSDNICLSFFSDELETNYKSDVLFQASEREPDIAILKLEDEAPSCASIGKLAVKENFDGIKLKACGFSSGKEGEWVSLTEMGIVNPYLYHQINGSSSTGYKIDEGFSGTPVFDAKSYDIVGIIVSKERRPDVLSGCFISVKSIIDFFDENLNDLSIFKTAKYFDPLKTPLGEIANLIVTSLQTLPGDKERRNEIIKEIIDKEIVNKCKIDIKPWLRDEDLSFPLAMAMLNLGLSKSLPILGALKNHKMSPENIKDIFNLLVPSWVDSESAAYIYKSALNENDKNAVALNADEHSSAKMCIHRASRCPPGRWPSYSCLGKFGVNVVDDIIKEIEYLLIYNSMYSRRGSTNYDDSHQIRTELKSIEYNKKAGTPTFLIFNYSKSIVESLLSVQDFFPHVTLFLLTGDTYPQPAEFGKLNCKCLSNLGLDAEKQILEDIFFARKYVSERLKIPDIDDC